MSHQSNTVRQNDNSTKYASVAVESKPRTRTPGTGGPLRLSSSARSDSPAFIGSRRARAKQSNLYASPYCGMNRISNLNSRPRRFAAPVSKNAAGAHEPRSFIAHNLTETTIRRKLGSIPMSKARRTCARADAICHGSKRLYHSWICSSKTDMEDGKLRAQHGFVHGTVQDTV